VTTYPRVDTTYLSDDIYPKVPATLQGIKEYFPQVTPLLSLKADGKKGTDSLPKSKKVFDNKKVTDHHAIIPTNVEPQRVPLTREEKLVYDLVARRFIAAFYPDCEFASTTVLADINNSEFKATGRQILKNGWRELYIKDKNTEEKTDEDANDFMPEFTEGESGPHEPSLLKKQTQPPKYYTEGTLLRAMETAGKLVEDDELRDAMKENGIGRPSTRAAIIETLFKRRYIRKVKKNLQATQAGISLIDTINEELLKSAKLTGLWENKLRKIERNEYAAADFISELKEMVSKIVIDVLKDNSHNSIPVDDDKDNKKKPKK
jgi:DNA topoisomerase-3